MNLGKFHLALVLCLVVTLGAFSSTFAQTASPAVRQVGTIHSVQASGIVLKPDSGSDVHVTVLEGARLLRVEPGQTDLKTAVPMQLNELQKGDRILVRGAMSEDGKTLLASTIVAMKKEDLAQKQERELQEWQRHGAGGLVKAVNPASGDITISTMSPTGVKAVVIHTTPKTLFRRYALTSIKFDDAKPGVLADIKVGDQLRVRGSKNADGSEFTADQIVSGTFRNIAGKITATDAVAKTITVDDLATKTPVVVHVTDATEMHKIPEMLAQRLAIRLKGQANGESPTGAPQAQAAQGQRPSMPPRNGMGAGGEGGRSADLQQLLNRMPPMPFSELIKGDAVMIVSTVGTPTDVSAITLLNGVEPILTASPSSGALTPWNLGSLGADPAAAQ